MKTILHRLFFSFVALTIAITMSAQENPSKKSAKKVAETGSQGDQIHARKIQQKQLHDSPVVLSQTDSAKLLSKKSPAAKKKKNKKHS